MRILHGTWLGDDAAERAGTFALWAETSETRAGASARQHPFAMTTRDLQSVLKELSSGNPPERNATKSSVALWLPSTRSAPQPSLEILSNDVGGIAQGSVTLAKWRADALIIAPRDTLDLLVSLPASDETPHGIKIGSDLRYWQVVAKFAFELLARQRLKPTLEKKDERFFARWQPLVNQPDEQARLTRLVRAMPPICRAVSSNDKAAKVPAISPRELLDDFIATSIDAFARENVDFGRVIEPNTIAEQWLNALWDRKSILEGSPANLAAFYEQYRAWAEPVGTQGGDTFRICFRLDPPQAADHEGIVAPKAHARDWSLRYLLQANDDPSLLVPADAVWRERGSALKFLNRKFDAPQEHLLAGLGLASKMFPPIDTSLRSARPEA